MVPYMKTQYGKYWLYQKCQSVKIFEVAWNATIITSLFYLFLLTITSLILSCRCA